MWSVTARELAKRINSEWTLEDGACATCINVLAKSAEESERPMGKATGSYEGFYRYHLPRRENALWNHVNPDMQTRRQKEIIDRVSEEAVVKGFAGWLIFDVDEGLIGQGVTTPDE
jgi:hypothetical protein